MKTVDEIMALVREYGDACSDDPKYYAQPNARTDSDLLSAIEAALKEREEPPKAQPMSEADAAHLNETIDWYNFPVDLIRATERHHKIGD